MPRAKRTIIGKGQRHRQRHRTRERNRSRTGHRVLLNEAAAAAFLREEEEEEGSQEHQHLVYCETMGEDQCRAAVGRLICGPGGHQRPSRSQGRCMKDCEEGWERTNERVYVYFR